MTRAYLPLSERQSPRCARRFAPSARLLLRGRCHLFPRPDQSGRLRSHRSLSHIGAGAVPELKYAPLPVVGAAHGLALGGGCETLLHVHEAVAHAELSAGLPESTTIARNTFLRPASHLKAEGFYEKRRRCLRIRQRRGNPPGSLGRSQRCRSRNGEGIAKRGDCSGTEPDGPLRSADRGRKVFLGRRRRAFL